MTMARTDRPLRIATRKSALALWQANFIKAGLEAAHPGLVVELVPLMTTGDKILDVPLAKVGGKGLFTKEIEQALIDNRADLAVHSMKDVPTQRAPGLMLAGTGEREARGSARAACAARPSCCTCGPTWRSSRSAATSRRG